MRHGTALLKTIWTQSDTHVLELRKSLLKTMWKSDTHVLESFGENYNYLPRFLAPNVCSSTTHSISVLNSLTTLLSSNAIFEEQRANPQWTKVLLIKASDLIEIPTPLMFFFSRASAKRGGQTSKRDIWPTQSAGVEPPAWNRGKPLQTQTKRSNQLGSLRRSSTVVRRRRNTCG